jgi:tRNA threonylcarbamoyladenosine biosynthesis protein TsaB
MQEVYWGGFEISGDEVMETVTECVVAPEQVPLPQQVSDWLGVGSGWQSYHDILMTRTSGFVSEAQGSCLPHAVDIARLGLQGFRQGAAVPAQQAVPVYLRDQVVNRA